MSPRHALLAILARCARQGAALADALIAASRQYAAPTL
jgi:hypothetical protein